MSTAVY